ncbi:hypothetical protein ANO11243_057070 [Dothideomycetidae sp. 11243]|nr:hypothetical protein ANO11243_057070 [fungal sp. No.11243]
MASNKAAWLTEAHGTSFKVDSAPLPNPGPDQVVVCNKAVAVNPVDWKMRDYGILIQNYPAVLGSDLAGIVHEVGSDVKNVRKGDRVTGHAGANLLNGKPEDAAFQLYSRCPAVTVAKIPDSLSFKDAAVLPLAISTVSMALYLKEALALPYPSLSPKKSGKVILIWGGASAIGTMAIQLARASGVTVVTTASKRNHTYCKDLGADAVIDYTASDAVDQVLSAINAEVGEFAGAFDAISGATFDPVAEIVQKAGGRKIIATVNPPDSKPEGIEVKGVFGPDAGANQSEVGKAVWQDFVPAALQNGSLKCLPEPQVVGQGLESIYEGLVRSKQGVSATKLVIEL